MSRIEDTAMSGIESTVMSGITNISLNRRSFIGYGLASGTALMLGFSLPGCSRQQSASKDTQELTAFILLDEQGQVTVLSPFIEMGQGTYTAIPMLVAEELDIGMDAVTVQQAPPGAAYRLLFNNSARFTGGSLSIRSAFQPLRQAGAAARQMLLQAAADKWQVSADQLSTKQGQVINPANNATLGYGELAATAAALPVPETVTLKDNTAFTLLGTSPARLDAVAKSNGQAGFGIDRQLPGMLIAAVKQSPIFGGEVDTFEAGAVLDMPGVAAVETIPNGIAVLADNYWHATTALNKLPVTFKGGIDSAFSSDGYLQSLRARLDEAGVTAEQHGDVAAALADGETIVSAEYHTPFLAHVTMEPMNCTALVTDDSCTLWAPNQGVDQIVGLATQITGLQAQQITVHTPYLGGGFGRRFIGDYVAQALVLAMKHRHKPIKVVWSREEDTQHDFYRPMTAAKYRAAIDKSGTVTALHTTTVGDGPIRRHMGAAIGEDGVDPSVMEGVTEQGYNIANKRHDYVFEYSPPPVGFWRSVGNSHNAFFNESFIDEIAHAKGQDPVQLRRDLLADNPRFARVLNTAVQMAGWRSDRYRNADGVQCAMGVALHYAYQSIACEIAEVSVAESGLPRVHKVWCAVDCGFAIHPRIVTMQMESAVVYGLSAALHEQVRMEQGRAQNGNFDDYPVLPAEEMPMIQVQIINSGEAIGGMGEVGTPPIAPALCNALFTLTGKRLRSLPVGYI
ncbi:MAG: molybdopterin cofactor-binding domain-containing protein [Gammaproteobacteria bacterium]